MNFVANEFLVSFDRLRGIETAIFLQCPPETVETQRLYPLRHGARVRR